MRILSFLAVSLALTCGSAAAQSGQNTAPVALDESFVDIGGRWAGGREVSIWLRILEDSGVYVVCAATQGIRDNNDRRLLRAHKVMINGRVMQRGLHWAPNYAGVNLPTGQAAHCRRTSTAVIANPNFDIELQQTRF